MGKYIDAGDRDLEREPVLAADGRPLTEEDFEAMSRAAEAREAGRRGRPSLTGGAKHSPRVSSRLPEDLHERFLAKADAEGLSSSQALRQAIEHYVEAS